jgi:hypothetical protein
VTFNHGVEGSSPSALTNETGHNLHFPGFRQRPCVCTVSTNVLRRGLAFPLYVIVLILSYSGDALGILAAKIAGDDWPG